MKGITKTISFTPSGLEASDFKKRIPILTFIGGTQVGRRVMLADDAITLGRSLDCTIMIKDRAVSRFHIKIEYDPHSNFYIVNDLGSSNGTLLNEKVITTSALNEGDKIIIGHTVLRFSWVDTVDIAFHGEVDRLINIDGLTAEAVVSIIDHSGRIVKTFENVSNSINISDLQEGAYLINIEQNGQLHTEQLIKK